MFNDLGVNVDGLKAILPHCAVRSRLLEGKWSAWLLSLRDPKWQRVAQSQQDTNDDNGLQRQAEV